MNDFLFPGSGIFGEYSVYILSHCISPYIPSLQGTAPAHMAELPWRPGPDPLPTRRFHPQGAHLIWRLAQVDLR